MATEEKLKSMEKNLNTVIDEKSNTVQQMKEA